MKIEIDATYAEVSKLIEVLGQDQGLSGIKEQLVASLALNSDSQAAEIPKEGDNPIIKRNE